MLGRLGPRHTCAINLDSFVSLLLRYLSNKDMSAPKFAKALIGGNWKCNGTVSSVRSMAEVLNKAGKINDTYLHA